MCNIPVKNKGRSYNRNFTTESSIGTKRKPKIEELLLFTFILVVP